MVVLAVAVVKIMVVLLLEVQVPPGKAMLEAQVASVQVAVVVVPVLWVKMFLAQDKAEPAVRELDQLLPGQMLPMPVVAVVVHTTPALLLQAVLGVVVQEHLTQVPQLLQ
jgi:hypothetical protein